MLEKHKMKCTIAWELLFLAHMDHGWVIFWILYHMVMHVYCFVALNQ